MTTKYIEHDGTGLDKVCATNKKLKFKWKKGEKIWDDRNEKWIPSKHCQCSYTYLKHGWELVAVNWNLGYGYHINHYDNIVLSSDTEAFPNRLECQLAAEKDLKKFLRTSLKLNFKR